MSWAQNTPVQRMLMLVILSTCSLVLLVACVMLGAFQMVESRTSLVRDITILADVAGRNTQAALAFQDEAAARETLMALQTAGDVQAARLYAADGAPFADYVRSATEVALPARPIADGEIFAGNHLTIVRAVTLDGKRVGTILLQASLAGRNARLLLFAAIAAIVLFASLGVGVVVSSRLQRSISAPIQRLAMTARSIAANKDYKVRAESAGTNETGQLTEAFNQVLTGIEEREKALKDANSALRAEVIERQRVDVIVQKQLGRLELLHQITRAIGERQDLQSIFPVVIGRLEDHLPIDFGCVCLHDAQKNQLSVASVGPRSGELAQQFGLSQDLSFDIAGRQLEDFVSGQLHYEPDLSASQTPLLKRMAEAGLGSLVVAPLPVAGQLFGILVTARRRARGFESAECEFLKQLSEHVAVAAHQLQLHGSLQQAYDDLRHTQQAVMQQERLRALGQMASGIAHDINNALSPVSLYTESLLEQEEGLSPRAKGQLKTIQRAIDDVAQTVARMREFYRQRETQIQLAPVNVNDLLQQVIDLSRARWNDMPLQRGVVVTMRTELAPEAPLIMAVESEIREALVNLIFNAVDAMPDGGILTLRTRVVGSRVRGEANSVEPQRVHIEVSDTGVGMSDEVRKRCLEPFYTTKGERGTGLGLAMVYGVVERHSSELEIDSRVGHGTTIRLSFAVPESIVPSSSDTTQMNIILPSLRILVVDDDPLVLKSLRDALEGDSHQVTTANGGEAGIEIFRSHCLRGETFAIVITDLGMPYIDGRKVASAVKASSPATPVILLTGWGQRLIAEGDVPEGVDRVLNKPPRLRELRAALAKCVKQTSFTDSTYRTA